MVNWFMVTWLEGYIVSISTNTNMGLLTNWCVRSSVDAELIPYDGPPGALSAKAIPVLDYN